MPALVTCLHGCLPVSLSSCAYALCHGPAPQVANFIDCAVKIAGECKAATPAPGKLKEFTAYLAGEGAQREDVKQLKAEVEAFARGFPMPGL